MNDLEELKAFFKKGLPPTNFKTYKTMQSKEFGIWEIKDIHNRIEQTI